MKISPALQLVMKSVASATTRKILNLNPWPFEVEVEKKMKTKIKKAGAN
jgi:hypothetical protein